MIFLIIFALISFLILRENQFSSSHDISHRKSVLLVAIGVFIVSVIPTLNIPYLHDDLTILKSLASAIRNGNTLPWLFLPHNEHVMPVTKMFYLIFYKLFGIQPQAFHAVVILAVTATCYVFYMLMWRLTGSPLSSLLGIGLLVSTNLMDHSIFIITMSEIIFCAGLYLIMFLAQYNYMEYRQKKWMVLFVAALVLNPAIFGLGLGSIFFVLLFHFLCIPEKFRKNFGHLFVISAVGWGVSLIPYIVMFDNANNASHYADIGKESALKAISFTDPAFHYLNLIKSVIIPRLFYDPYISFGLFFFWIFWLIYFRKKYDWNKVAFFFLFSTIISYVIFAFRSGWGAGGIYISRYTVFPVLMVSALYVIGCNMFLTYIRRVPRKWGNIALIIVMFCICYSASLRYGKAEADAREYTQKLHRFYAEYSDSVNKFFETQPESDTLNLADLFITLTLNSSETVAMRRGSTVVYDTLQNFGSYVLPDNTFRRIIWGERSDPEFVEFIHSFRDDKYMFMKTVFTK